MCVGGVCGGSLIFIIQKLNLSTEMASLSTPGLAVKPTWSATSARSIFLARTTSQFSVLISLRGQTARRLFSTGHFADQCVVLRSHETAPSRSSTWICSRYLCYSLQILFERLLSAEKVLKRISHLRSLFTRLELLYTSYFIVWFCPS